MPREMLLPVVCGRCYNHIVYTCLGWCYCLWLWQMLLPILPQILLWLMLLPRCHICIITTKCWYLYGRCFCQVADGIATLIIVLADVIAKWQMEWPLQGWSIGRRYCHVADGIATGSYYLSLSSEVLNRTSSHMWGRWYLPMFLFRDGLLTLMYRASLMALMRFCSSLPTMLKFSKETWNGMESLKRTERR